MATFYRNAILLALTLCAVLALSACERRYPQQQYWQRTNTSTAALSGGPKAHQLLQRDIYNCVNELRELERLNEIHDPIKTAYNNRIIPSDPLATDERNRQASATNEFEYKDFDGCMYAKGWERTHFVPYNTHITADDLRTRHQ